MSDVNKQLLDALTDARNEPHRCQAVIHLAGGFDPAYVSRAKAAIIKADEAIAAAEQAQHNCKNCEGVQPETCGFNAQPPAVAAPVELRSVFDQMFDYSVDPTDDVSREWLWRFSKGLVGRLSSKPPALAVPAQAAAIPDELTCEDIERLRLALSWEGYSTPESLEACAARWPSLVRDLIAGVLDRKKRTQSSAQKGGA